MRKGLGLTLGLALLAVAAGAQAAPRCCVGLNPLPPTGSTPSMKPFGTAKDFTPYKPWKGYSEYADPYGLSRAPANVTELAEPFDMSLAAVSKHLGVLERAGLLTRAADGRARLCALNAAPLGEAEQWLAQYRAFWGDTLDALASFVEDEPGPRPRGRR